MLRARRAAAGAARCTPTWPRPLAWGAQLRFTGRRRPQVGRRGAARRRRGSWPRAGARPYVVPRGGACTGRRARLPDGGRRGRSPSSTGGTRTVVVAAGAGGTLAGLVAGNVARGRPLRIVGASVSRPPDEVAPAGARDRAGPSRAPGGEEPAPTADDVELVDVRGPGHGLALPRGRVRPGARAAHAPGWCSTRSTRRRRWRVLPAVAARRARAVLAHRRPARRGRRVARCDPVAHRACRGGVVTAGHRLGPPLDGPAPELVESGLLPRERRRAAAARRPQPRRPRARARPARAPA